MTERRSTWLVLSGLACSNQPPGGLGQATEAAKNPGVAQAEGHQIWRDPPLSEIIEAGSEWQSSWSMRYDRSWAWLSADKRVLGGLRWIVLTPLASPARVLRRNNY
jgi:hypothetical protein